MFKCLTIGWLGVELLRVTVESDDEPAEFVPECVACEDSGDPCALCGDEQVEAE